MRARFFAIFERAPVLFFVVVLGVALGFRLTIGAVRDAVKPDDVVTAFVAGPEPGLPSAKPSSSAPSAPLPEAEVGAAAKVEPLGAPPRERTSPRAPRRRPRLRRSTTDH